MFTIKLLRFLRGTVRFSAQGGAMERLMNLIAQHGLNLWDLAKVNGAFQGFTLAKEYKKIAKMARKCGVRTKVLERHGLPFFLRKYRRRLGAFIGIAAVVLFLFIMQNFIWSVEVSGNKNLSEEYVLSTMEKLGVHKGAFKPALDFKAIEIEARSKLEGVSWVGVNQSGSKVWIEIRESVKAPDIVPTTSPCNIVARRTGQITKLQIFAGQGVVQKGDVVEEGDLIVSGIIEDPNGNTTLRHASAKVYATTQFDMQFKIPLKSQKKEYTGETKKRYILDLFGLKLPLFLATKQAGTYDVTPSYQKLNLFGVDLPFGLYTNEYKFYQMKSQEFTDKQAAEEAEKQRKEYEKNELKDAEILDQKSEKDLKNGELILTVHYTCQEEIGKMQEIYTNDAENQKS